MKNLIFVFTVFLVSISNVYSQKYLLNFSRKLAYCPIDGCEYLKKYKNGDLQYTCPHEVYRLKYNNFNWSSEYVLLDPYDGLRVLPTKIKKNGKVFYKIYYSSENDHKARKGTFEESELEKMKVYKFKTKKHNNLFWEGKTNIVHYSDDE